MSQKKLLFATQLLFFFKSRYHQGVFRTGVSNYFWSTGHIASLFVIRGPNASQKGQIHVEKFPFAGQMRPVPGLEPQDFDEIFSIKPVSKKLPTSIL
jgi:hypothetical protein